jgi:hypothetical protein
MQIITNLIVILSRAREIFDREFQDFINNEIVREDKSKTGNVAKKD